MKCKISYPTAFYWRRKILEVMKNFDKGAGYDFAT